MPWAAIIVAIVNLFGPVLAEWLKKWLESWLNKTAAGLATIPEQYSCNASAASALFDAAIISLPRWAIGRRALLRRMKAVATADGKIRSNFDSGDACELLDLGKLAEND